MESLTWPGKGDGRIPFAWHSWGAEERAEAFRALMDGVPSSAGPLVVQFEAAVAKYVGAKYAIATSSCTAALEACSRAVLQPGDNAVVPTYTFHATANGPLAAGAEVRFTDIESGLYHMSGAAAFAASDRQTGAIYPMHYAGVAYDMTAIQDVAWARGAVVIEDAAMALGADYPSGGKVGSLQGPVLCCFSLGPTKPITVGYGGIITTSDDELAAKVRAVVNQGMVRRTTGQREQVGPAMNARMGEIQAAIGLAQLAKLDGFIVERNRLATLYWEGLGLPSIPGVELPPWPALSGNWSLFPVKLLRRQAVYDALAKEGIETAVHYRPVHLHSAWAGYPGVGGRASFRFAEEAAEWELSLPLFPGMSEADIDRVCSVIRRVNCQKATSQVSVGTTQRAAVCQAEATA